VTATRPERPTYTARSYVEGQFRYGSTTWTSEGHIPVCGRRLKRLTPEPTKTQGESALDQHWRDNHRRRDVA
jgi:hypothetical protein